ncbi:MAG TPA: metallophosphoesterase [Puia sp.]|nr:metallophosphoesterase [Puia sp.]
MNHKIFHLPFNPGAMFILSLLLWARGAYGQPPQPKDGKKGEVTFFIVSDMHYGVNDSIGRINGKIIDEMNGLQGKWFASDSVVFQVGKPAGVVVTGDLTDAATAAQWAQYSSIMKPDGRGSLHYPVYDGFGNHDGPIEGPVRRGLRARNAARRGLSSLSPDSVHYSWDWGDAHFVQLNLYPGNRWVDSCEWCHYFKTSFREPQNSLDFLERDLEAHVAKSGRPVILFSHYGFDAWGVKWWTRPERARLLEVVRKYHVIAYFFGHTHQYERGDWNGIPYFCVGSSQKQIRPGEFVVVRLHDRKMYVAVREVGRWKELSVIDIKDYKNK